jgi:hypothetical protein
VTARATRDAPFCWQSKEALRRIRDWFDESNNVASALATHLALSEIESNTGTAGAFVATQSDIAKRVTLPNELVSDSERFGQSWLDCKDVSYSR